MTSSPPTCVDLHICFNTVILWCYFWLQEELYCYPLHHISYCADDKRDKKLFAFIAKDKANPEHNCYVFECEKLVSHTKTLLIPCIHTTLKSTVCLEPFSLTTCKLCFKSLYKFGLYKELVNGAIYLLLFLHKSHQFQSGNVFFSQPIQKGWTSVSTYIACFRILVLLPLIVILGRGAHIDGGAGVWSGVSPLSWEERQPDCH